MKTFVTTLVLSTATLAAPAIAFGTMDNLVRDLSFPDTVTEPVTRDQKTPTK